MNSPKLSRDVLRVGEIVMVCEHLWNRSSCRVRMAIPVAPFKSFNPPVEVERVDDGTKFLASYVIVCARCFEVSGFKSECLFEAEFDGETLKVAGL